MDYFIYGVVGPLTSYAPARVAGEEQLGTLFGTYAVGVLVATPLAGFFGDRRGCRLPMISGVVLSAAAVALFCLGTNFSVMLLGRFLQGAASAFTWTSGLALVAEHYIDRRVQMMGYALMAATAGSVFGPMAAGWLFHLGAYTLPFLLTGALVGLDALFRILFLPKEQGSTESLAAMEALLVDKSVLTSALAVAIAAAAWAILEPLLPAHIGKTGHMAPWVVGAMFSVATIAYGFVVPLVGKMVQKISIQRTVCLGAIALAATLPLVAFCHGPWLLGGALTLVSVAWAFLLNPASAELGNAVDRRRLTCYAPVYAIFNIAYSIGMVGIDVFAAELGARLTFLQALLVMGGICLLSVPILFLGFAVPGAHADARSSEERSGEAQSE